MSLFRLIAFFALFYGLILTAYGQSSTPLPASGVPYGLARQRAAILKDIQYKLHFHLPASAVAPVSGEETIEFTLAIIPAMPLAIDFKASPDAVRALRVNQTPTASRLSNEHLVIPAASLHAGRNTIYLAFTAGNSALNRNSEFIYTLLVPDKARSLFPCFDQPDLKAIYSLTLTMPSDWSAISNGPLADSTAMGDSCRLRFEPSDRLSTYLFSFAAGRFSATTRLVDGRPMRFLYRETDSTKIRLSIDSIFRIEGQALRFLKEYTGIDYPFSKFDFVAIPDFQFGGMEHAGAIQYKASSLFLDSGATREQLIGRSNLLSHETAHMWFGDLVTMRWFNDVWMKEVFANFMADKISFFTLPDANYDLKFVTAHYGAAYSVDRTKGAHPIRQQLDNLNDAGSLYGNIIYHKAPIVMRQLERLLGVDSFRAGLREYLKRYTGGNASWPDLIKSLQHHASFDLGAWSAVWVDGVGRPAISYQWIQANGRIKDLVIRQRGEDGSARVWPQSFEIALVYKDHVQTLPVVMQQANIHLAAQLANQPMPEYVVLNTDGAGFGLFSIDGHSLAPLFSNASGPTAPAPLMRAAVYINLYENMLAGHAVTPRELLALDRQLLAREPEELNLNILLEQINSIFWRFLPAAARDSIAPGLEQDCWQALEGVNAPNEKKLLFRTFSNIVLSKGGQDRLYDIWKKQQPPAGVKLSEDDYTNLAAALAIRNYPGAAAILDEQTTRIQNKDRRDRWLYLQPALSNDTVTRDRYFASLHDAAARRKEAWVLSALGYLHHPLRTATSEKYLPATLDWLEDIQRTGDVFFPQSWLQASFSYYQTPTAASGVRNFIKTHPDYNPKLRAKIWQATDNLLRAISLIK
jgi:aminopeptidase N